MRRVVLVLAAKYESWVLPMAIVLIVPMCILAALFGVWLSQGPILSRRFPLSQVEKLSTHRGV